MDFSKAFDTVSYTAFFSLTGEIQIEWVNYSVNKELVAWLHPKGSDQQLSVWMEMGAL